MTTEALLFSRLPEDIQNKILAMSGPKGIANFSSTCKDFHRKGEQVSFELNSFLLEKLEKLNEIVSLENYDQLKGRISIAGLSGFESLRCEMRNIAWIQCFQLKNGGEFAKAFKIIDLFFLDSTDLASDVRRSFDASIMSLWNQGLYDQADQKTQEIPVEERSRRYYQMLSKMVNDSGSCLSPIFEKAEEIYAKNEKVFHPSHRSMISRLFDEKRVEIESLFQ